MLILVVAFAFTACDKPEEPKDDQIENPDGGG